MKYQLLVLIVCVAAFGKAQEQPEEQQQETTVATEEAVDVDADAARASVQRPDINNFAIRRILEENSKTLEQLDNKAITIGNSQKGIEHKLRLLGQDVAGIGRLEDGLKKLESVTQANFQLTANGIKNLSSSLRALDNKTDQAIVRLGLGQQDIKQSLTKIDLNQSKHERSLDQAARSVNLRLSALDNLIKQSVLKELLTLVQGAKKIEQSQRRIESKVGHLDELTALAGITANKVQQLENGLRYINRTQSHQLAAIGETVQLVGATTWQIDNKLGVLLSTQKNIERALVECKKHLPTHRDPHKQPEVPHDHWEQSSYVTYENKDEHKSPAKENHGFNFGHRDDDSYLYQLWYGKDDK